MTDIFANAVECPSCGHLCIGDPIFDCSCSSEPADPADGTYAEEDRPPTIPETLQMAVDELVNAMASRPQKLIVITQVNDQLQLMTQALWGMRDQFLNH